MLWKNKTGRRPESSSPTAEKGAIQRKCLAAMKRKASFPFGRIVFCCIVKRYVKNMGVPRIFCVFSAALHVLRRKVCFPLCDPHKKAVRYGLYRTAVRSLSRIARRMAQSARPCRHRNYASTAAAAASCAARWSR